MPYIVLRSSPTQRYEIVAVRTQTAVELAMWFRERSAVMPIFHDVVPRRNISASNVPSSVLPTTVPAFCHCVVNPTAPGSGICTSSSVVRVVDARQLQRVPIVDDHVETELRLLRRLRLEEPIAERRLGERAVRADGVGLVLVGERRTRAGRALRESELEFVDALPLPPRLLRHAVGRAAAVVRVPLLARAEERARVAPHEAVEDQTAVVVEPAGEEIALAR